MSHLLIAAKTYEEKLCQILDFKSRTLDLSLNGGTGKERLNLMEMLLEMMAPDGTSFSTGRTTVGTASAAARNGGGGKKTRSSMRK